MRISPARIRKSKNTSIAPAVRPDTCDRRENCNTVYSSESQVMEKAPSNSSSDTTRTSSVPTRPRTNPTRVALADIRMFLDDKPGA